MVVKNFAMIAIKSQKKSSTFIKIEKSQFSKFGQILHSKRRGGGAIYNFFVIFHLFNSWKFQKLSTSLAQICRCTRHHAYLYSIYWRLEEGRREGKNYFFWWLYMEQLICIGIFSIHFIHTCAGGFRGRKVGCLLFCKRPIRIFP